MGLKDGLTMLVVVALVALWYSGVSKSHQSEVDAYARCVSEKIEDMTAPAPARARQLTSYSEELWPRRSPQLSRWVEGICQAANEKWDDMFDNDPATKDW